MFELARASFEIRRLFIFLFIIPYFLRKVLLVLALNYSHQGRVHNLTVSNLNNNLSSKVTRIYITKNVQVAGASSTVPAA